MPFWLPARDSFSLIAARRVYAHADAHRRGQRTRPGSKGTRRRPHPFEKKSGHPAPLLTRRPVVQIKPWLLYGTKALMTAMQQQNAATTGAPTAAPW